MRANFIGRVMLSRLFGVVVLCGLLFSQAVAQDPCDNPNVWCGPEKKKSQKPATTRPATNRKPRRAAPLGKPLQFQWELLKIDNDGKKNLVSIGNISSLDRFLLSIRIVENGYLYVIRQPSPEGDGRLIFPSKYYNRGDNRVLRGDEFILPDCSNSPISMLPSVANERLIVILSRKPISDLQLYPVTKNVILGLRNAPGQQPSVRGVGETLNTYFMEANSVNTEKIIETLVILNGARVVKVDTGTVATN